MRIDNEQVLDDLLSEPTPQLVEMFQRLAGDIVVLGVAGKMGPTLARMARRAADAAGGSRRVIGVSRFSGGGEADLNQHGVETIRCDLLDPAAVGKLPEAENIIYLAGRKFGSSGDESTTWAMNALVPANVCRRYPRSRFVALSTGNVYPLVSCSSTGSCEADSPHPVGEYAMSGLARERIFEHFSRTNGTPLALIRLNYACDLRYGVLVDLAQKVQQGAPIDLTMGYFNTIWQRDANAMTLRALEHATSLPWVVNLTGPEKLAVRVVAAKLGVLLNKPVRLAGSEAETALLSDACQGIQRLGPLTMPAEELIQQVADWIARGGRTLNKPTHFETRDGKF
jgi:nucleoside-diphosphate-sugar epimerase